MRPLGMLGVTGAFDMGPLDKLGVTDAFTVGPLDKLGVTIMTYASLAVCRWVR